MHVLARAWRAVRLVLVLPYAVFDKLTERYVDGDWRRERSLVEDGPEAARGLFWRDMARSGVFLVATLAVVWLPDGALWLVFAQAALGAMVGYQALALSRRASAYRRGWLAGRRRFIEQAKVHEAAGNTPADWLRTEFEHDAVNVMGGVPVALLRDDIPRDDKP